MRLLFNDQTSAFHEDKKKLRVRQTIISTASLEQQLLLQVPQAHSLSRKLKRQIESFQHGQAASK